jgi:hypothetical protein
MWSAEKPKKAFIYTLQYRMATAASPTNREKRKEDDKMKKVTKVLFTKLSIED